MLVTLPLGQKCLKLLQEFAESVITGHCLKYRNWTCYLLHTSVVMVAFLLVSQH